MNAKRLTIIFVVMAVLISSFVAAAGQQYSKKYGNVIETNEEGSENVNAQNTQTQTQTQLAERLRIHKEDFDQTRLRLQDCRKSNTESECGSIKLELKVKAKNTLENGLQNAIAVMEQTKARISGDTSIPQEVRNRIVANIEEKIKHMETVRARVGNLGNESSDNEINEAAKEAKAKWEEAKKTAREERGRFNNEKAGVIITKMEQLSERVEKIISTYSDKGVDTSQISELKSNFDAKVAEAKSSYESAKAIWDKENRTAEEVQQAHDFMKKSQASLKEAHSILKEISVKLRELANASKQQAQNKTE